MAASTYAVDFTNVKDAGQFNPKHQPPGDYRAKVTKVEDAKSKGDQGLMWVFTIQVGSGTYPYYCKLTENQYWKVRNLLLAAGISVPKKRVKVDPNKLVGKTIAVTLGDDEYEGKMKSVIESTFPVSELDQTDDEDDEDEVEDTDDDEDDDDTPAVKSANSKAAAKAKAEVQDDDDDEDDDEDDTPPPPKKKKAKAEVQEDEDDEDEDEEPAPKAKKKKAKPADDDDDLEDIDIDEV